jgi:hypothetical protein
MYLSDVDADHGRPYALDDRCDGPGIGVEELGVRWGLGASPAGVGGWR